jgi:predicted outer membrane protein
MTTHTSRTIVISMIMALSLSPLYAHHGNQFLSTVMEANTAEVKLAEMAVNKTQDPRIKEFAQMLIRDHNEALDNIRALRDARMVASVSANHTVTRGTTKIATADVQLTAAHRQESARLNGLSGTNFDVEFINVMVNEHRQAIRDFEAQTHVHGNALTRNQPKTGSGQQTAREKPSPSGQKTYSRAELSQDLDTSEFAQAMLPTLRHHLEQAEEIQKQLQTK